MNDESTHMTTPHGRSGAALRVARAYAMAGFLFGAAISVAANVMHAWLPFMLGSSQAMPGLAPQVGAAVWPLALVLSVEILSRVPWRAGWAWQLARYGGAGVVAVGAAVISYGHLHEVLAAWGYGTLGTAVGPLVIDGLMTISGFALLSMNPTTPSATTGTQTTTMVTTTRPAPGNDGQVPGHATTQARPTSRRASSTRAGPTNAPRPARTDGGSHAQSSARAVFDRALTEGRADAVTGGELARAAGVHPGTARKWLAAWRAETTSTAPAPAAPESASTTPTTTEKAEEVAA